MEPDQIKKLLEKYYDGVASQRDEQLLRNYFLNNNVPPELLADKELFTFVQTEASSVPQPVGLEQKLENWVNQQEHTELKSRRSIKIYRFASIAAGLAILATTYFGVQQYHKQKLSKDTYKDPQVAYNEVKRTLLYISEQLNRGTKPLTNVSKINDGINGLSAFSSFGSGLKELELVSKYYESNNENNNTK